MLQIGIVVWHGNFHDFDDNHVYTDYFPWRLHWQMKKTVKKFPAAKRSRFVLVDVEIGGGEMVRVVDDGFKKGRR